MRPGSPIPFVPSAALVVRADVATGPELFDAGPARRRGRRPRVAPRRGGMGRPLRAGEHRRTRRAGDARVLPGAPGLLRDDGRAAGPPPPGLAGTRPRLGVVAGRVGPGAGPATGARAGDAGGVHRPSWPTASRASCGIPSRWRPASPAAARRAPPCPSLAGLARAWSPALLLGLAFRRTRTASALALVLPALGDWVPNRDALDPLRFAALHVADDAAYGAGVWAGCARERTVVPLVPRISWRSRVWSSRALRAGPASPADGSGPAAALAPGEATLLRLVLPVRRLPEGHGEGVVPTTIACSRRAPRATRRSSRRAGASPRSRGGDGPAPPRAGRRTPASRPTRRSRTRRSPPPVRPR